VTDPEQYRSRLFGLAYRMLGVRAEAEDVVQDVLMRWYAEPRGDVTEPLGWLITAATRRCIDRLRSAAVQRQAYPGPWLPEPIVEPEPVEAPAELASELSVAFLLILERLAPDERAAFLLADAFEMGHADIAAIIGKSEAATRQILHRARQRVRVERPSRQVDHARARELVARFLSAWQSRDQSALMDVLASDVTYTSDGGGRVSAIRRTVTGVDRVMRFLAGARDKYFVGQQIVPALVSGTPGYLLIRDGKVAAVTALELDGDRISAFYTVLNPDKLPRPN
jgi:RNA polymerase sigma-70 factor, ECF subfamily